MTMIKRLPLVLLMLRLGDYRPVRCTSAATGHLSLISVTCAIKWCVPKFLTWVWTSYLSGRVCAAKRLFKQPVYQLTIFLFNHMAALFKSICQFLTNRKLMLEKIDLL